MKQKYRILGAVLSCLMLLLPMTAFAEEEIPNEQQPITEDTYDFETDTNDDGIMSSEMYSAPAKVIQSSGYQVRFQNVPEFRNIAYGKWGGNIYSTACGPSAACNALNAAGIADITIPDMCKIAEDSGARYNGGTTESVLLKALMKKYDFTFTSTNDPAQVRKHLQNGGIAIAHAGTSYRLFTERGHYLALVKIDSSDNVTILDSYWEDDKFTDREIRRKNVKVLSTGVVQTSLAQLDKACADRSPRYFLLNTNSKPDTPDPDSELPFTDVRTSSWYYEDVKAVYEQKLMKGMTTTKFEPNGQMTRAQAVQILYNYETEKYGTPTVENPLTFTDVPDGKWYKTAVDWASANGIVNGMGNNKFEPNSNVTREQFAKIMGEYMKKKVPDKYDAGTEETLNSFSDKDRVANFAKEYMTWAVHNGIINGTKDNGKITLNPKGNTRRCEAAAIIRRYTALVG